jgi:hypothetical protein
MHNKKLKLPKTAVNKVYSMVSVVKFGVDGTTTSQGDPSNGCTTILSTTHFI